MPSPPITPANRPEGSAPCAAAIVFAVAIEADAFERMATDRVETIANGLTIHAGRVAGRRVAWSVAGVGQEPASRAALLLVDGHRPGVLVSAGFAGGLDPALPRGAVVRPARVIHAGSAAALELAAGQQGVDAGAAITKAEQAVLAAKGLTGKPGLRLSCQIACDGDMTVRVVSRLAGSGRADAGKRPADAIEPSPEWA